MILGKSALGDRSRRIRAGGGDEKQGIAADKLLRAKQQGEIRPAAPLGARHSAAGALSFPQKAPAITEIIISISRNMRIAQTFAPQQDGAPANTAKSATQRIKKDGKFALLH